MKEMRLVLACLMFCLAAPAPSSAHHSFKMYDKEQETWLDGTVKEFQWSNPHTFIQLTVAADGKATEWSLEGGSPNILVRNGWKRTVLQPGEKVKVLIYPLRSGEPGGSFIEVHKEDGTVLYYHG